MILLRDFTINYKDIVVMSGNKYVLTRYKTDNYSAVIDHQKDIVVMSGNRYVLTRNKADNYSDLMIKSLYIVVNYIAVGVMYMYKMGTLPFSWTLQHKKHLYIVTLILLKMSRFHQLFAVVRQK